MPVDGRIRPGVINHWSLLPVLGVESGGPLTAPMGEGKTEAALYAAEVMDRAAGRPGLYVALPTMATTDQMYSRVKDRPGRRSTVASSMTPLHSMAWLNPGRLPRQDTDATGELPEGSSDSAEYRRPVEAGD